MKVQATIVTLSLGLIIGGLTSAAIYGQATSAKASQSAQQVASDGYVGVYMSSVSRQIKMSDLTKAYPANRAGTVDRSLLAADAIVGWYDRGNNYHEQKMQNNLRTQLGGLRILPQLLRGQALRGEEGVTEK